MEHIAAEKGSAIEMVQKVSQQSYLAIFDQCYFVFSDSDFYWQNFIYPVLNCQILMTGGFWKFIGDGCCLGQISRTFLAFISSPFPDRRTDLLIKEAGFSSVAQTRYCKQSKYHPSKFHSRENPPRYKLPLPKGRAFRNLMAQPITPHLRGVATKW